MNFLERNIKNLCLISAAFSRNLMLGICWNMTAVYQPAEIHVWNLKHICTNYPLIISDYMCVCACVCVSWYFLYMCHSLKEYGLKWYVRDSNAQEILVPEFTLITTYFLRANYFPMCHLAGTLYGTFFFFCLTGKNYWERFFVVIITQTSHCC